MLKKQDRQTDTEVDPEPRSQYRAFWEELCVKLYQLIVAYARTLTCDPSQAEDLAQATVARVLHYLPEPDPIKDKLSYLKRTSKNLFLDSRKKSNDASLDELVESQPNHPALLDPTNQFETLEQPESRRTPFSSATPNLIKTGEILSHGNTWEEIAPASRFDLLQQADEIERILQQAVKYELSIHKRLGNPVAAWRDGKVVIIPPEEIVLSSES